MNDLKILVDKEIGNDTEQTRMNMLKYVNYGRQLQQQESGLMTKEQVDLMLKMQAENILAEIGVVMLKTAEAQREVEMVYEDQAFEKIKTQGFDINGDNISMLLAQFEELLKTTDEKHTEIIKTIREPGLQSIREKYLGVQSENQPSA
jgi:hypothetical protein